MIVLFEQAGDDLARGVVGVGDEVTGLQDGDDTEEGEHLVEQGAAVATGPHHPLADADGERQRILRAPTAPPNSSRLARDAEDDRTPSSWRPCGQYGKLDIL